MKWALIHLSSVKASFQGMTQAVLMEFEAHYGLTATTSALCINLLMDGVDLNGAKWAPVGVGDMGKQ